MSDPLPTDPYDQGVYDAANGNGCNPASWDEIAYSSQIEAYDAGYNGDPRPT